MPTQPRFPALAPQQRHRRKELGWGPAVLGVGSPLLQGRSALAYESRDECHDFVPTGTSRSPESLQAAWAGLYPSSPSILVARGMEGAGGGP